MEKEGDYFLSQSLMFHTGAARSVDILGDKLLSGGIDKKLNFYLRNKETGTFTHTAEYPFFKDYILFVKIISAQRFVVGCKDKNVYVCEFDNHKGPVLTLTGHQGPVNSVDVSGNVLVSGSWDATAKVWDLTTGANIKTLEGHAYAVTVCITSKNDILTGSQDGKLHLWDKNGVKVKTVDAHSNIIRCIVEQPGMGLLTCSNDQKVKLWSLDLDELTVFEDHSNFVFTLAYLHKESVDFVSGGEDFKLLVYQGGSKIQEIAHPNTVWSIAVDRENQNDLITASGDG